MREFLCSCEATNWRIFLGYAGKMMITPSPFWRMNGMRPLERRTAASNSFSHFDIISQTRWMIVRGYEDKASNI